MVKSRRNYVALNPSIFNLIGTYKVLIFTLTTVNMLLNSFAVIHFWTKLEDYKYMHPTLLNLGMACLG